MKYFVINAKNYSEAAGNGLENLIGAINDVAKKKEFKDVEFFLSPTGFGLASSIRSGSSFRVLAQHLDPAVVGASTGFSVPEIAKSFGAAGSLINHSEHRIPFEEIERLVVRLHQLGMISVVCAKDDDEVAKFSKLGPDFIAVAAGADRFRQSGIKSKTGNHNRIQRCPAKKQTSRVNPKAALRRRYRGWN